MKYKEYKIYTDSENLDQLIDELQIAGYFELIINDPRDAQQFKAGGETSFEWNFVDENVIAELEEGAWVSFYLGMDEKLNSEAESILKANDAKVTICDDEDWLHKWEEYYVPRKIGVRTVSKPVWRDYEPSDGEIVLDIDPGLAFGTGSSPTTYLAVQLMEKYLKEGDTMLDVGCGTGILSVCGAKLGASHIDAVDLDPEAVAATKVNIKINNCEEKVSVYHGDLLKDFDFNAEAIIANLTAELVMMLSEGLASHCTGRGLYISSGIIDIKEDKAIDAIKNAGFEILEILRDDCWTAVAARLK